MPYYLPAVSAPEPLFAIRGEMPHHLRGVPPSVPEDIALSIRRKNPNYCLPPSPKKPETNLNPTARIFTPIRKIIRNVSRGYEYPSPPKDPKTPEEHARKTSLEKIGNHLRSASPTKDPKTPERHARKTSVEKISTYLKNPFVVSLSPFCIPMVSSD